jgi:hypothetical protein
MPIRITERGLEDLVSLYRLETLLGRKRGLVDGRVAPRLLRDHLIEDVGTTIIRASRDRWTEDRVYRLTEFGRKVARRAL